MSARQTLQSILDAHVPHVTSAERGWRRCVLCMQVWPDIGSCDAHTAAETGLAALSVVETAVKWREAWCGDVLDDWTADDGLIAAVDDWLAPP